MHVPQDFKELLQLLNEAKIEYLVVGGYAVFYHGYPRTTNDIDIWINRNERNAQALVGALEKFGLGQAGLTAALFMHEHRLTRMGHPPMQVEFLTSLSGVEFAECDAARTMADLGGVVVPMIDLSNLLKYKAAAGRPKDLDDLIKLNRPTRKREGKT